MSFDTRLLTGAAVVTGRLRVSVNPWFARMVLTPKLQQFMARYPRLSVDLIVTCAAPVYLE